jgi:hypothetical protein
LSHVHHDLAPFGAEVSPIGREACAEPAGELRNHRGTSKANRMQRIATIIGVSGFVLGLVPLLALTFFSPGLRAEGVAGWTVFAIGVVTLLALLLTAQRRKWFWLLAAIQALLLMGVLVETFSDARLYIGT